MAENEMVHQDHGAPELYHARTAFQRSGQAASVSDLQRLLKLATDGSASASLDQDENTEDQASYGEDHKTTQTERKSMTKRLSALT
jgi:hypothetical protein